MFLLYLPLLQASGAYIFRPQDNSSFPVANSTAAAGVISNDGSIASSATSSIGKKPKPAQPAQVVIVTGPVVNEARQTFADWVATTVRLWAGSYHVDFEWTVGPIPIADRTGKEVSDGAAAVLAE